MRNIGGLDYYLIIENVEYMYYEIIKKKWIFRYN